jgi:hypothetical protein
MENTKRRRDSRTECVLHEIEERAARLRKDLAMLDQRMARDQASRRDEAERLHRYVDAVLSRVVSLERKLGGTSRGRRGNETIIMRAGQTLAAAADPPPRNWSAQR